ncbi:MAG: hypothetical protein R3A49_00695 [Acidimicrobiia bacterium]
MATTAFVVGGVIACLWVLAVIDAIDDVNTATDALNSAADALDDEPDLPFSDSENDEKASANILDYTGEIATRSSLLVASIAALGFGCLLWAFGRRVRVVDVDAAMRHQHEGNDEATRPKGNDTTPPPPRID